VVQSNDIGGVVGGFSWKDVQYSWETALALVFMYYEKVTFLDKLINILLSPFDRYIFNTNKKGDEYMEILGAGRDIPKLSKKWIEYFYLAVHIKLYEILSVVYNDYKSEPDHVFVYVDTRLNDIFLELLNLWKKLDKYPFIQEKQLGQYNGFDSLNADSDYRRKIWETSKHTLFEDIEELPSLSTIPLSNDLKSAFLEIDNLLVEHKKKKQRILWGDGVLEYKALKFDLNKSTLQVNNSEPVLINTETKVFTFLILLVKHAGKIVSYEDISEAIGTNNDKGGQRNIQSVKSDIYDIFTKLGFDENTAKEVRGYVEFITNQGATMKS